MKNICFISLCLIGLNWGLSAQNLDGHYMYQMNTFNVNPGLTGQEGRLNAVLTTGTLWAGVQGSPTNSMVGVHGKLNPSMGAGLKVIMDRRGVLNNFSFEGLYAYEVNVDGENFVRFGISMGMFQSKIDLNQLSQNGQTDLSDPSLYGESYNRLRFVSGMGMVLTNTNFQLGLSLPHLIVSGQSISSHIVGFANYTLKLKNNLMMRPQILVQSFSSKEQILDLGSSFWWKNMFWTELTYRTNNTLLTGFGTSMGGFNLGYTYTFAMGDLGVLTTGAHQVCLRFQIPD